MLDLSVFKAKTLDVKLPDGEIVRLNKPTQKMVIEMMKFKDISVDTKAEEAVKTLNSITEEILNTNDVGKKFSAEYIEQNITLDMKMALTQAYSAFITDITSDPN